MSCLLIATGRVGKVEPKTVGDKTVVRLSVCSSTMHKKSDNSGYETEWTQFDAWNKLAEYIEKNIHKGDVVEIHAEKFTRKSGEQYFTNYTVTKFERLAKGKESLSLDGGQPANVTQSAPASAPTMADDDIPF